MIRIPHLDLAAGKNMTLHLYNWTEIETDNNALTKYVMIEEGGGGGAGMFSALEWIVKGAVWFVLVLFVYAGYRVEQRSYVRVSRGWGVW